jgi:membrane-associated phospholipid phosphatase
MLTVSPDELGLLVVAITQLGDIWFLFALLLAVHWYRPGWLTGGRRDSAVVIATALLAVASVLTAKAAVALPRPAGATTATLPGWLPPLLAEATRAGATADGFGFPSGHAVTATAVYGGLAAAVDGIEDWRPRRIRHWLAGAVLVGAIAASRVLLGVHYPRDVVAGVALGSVILAIGLWLDEPDSIFALAVVVALSGAVVAALQHGPAEVADVAGTLGGAVGGSVAWRWSGAVTTRVPPLQVVVAGAGLTAIWGVSVSADSVSIVAAGSALAVGLGVGMPGIVQWRFASSP